MIYFLLGEIDTILTDHRIREDRLKCVVKTRTDYLELIHRSLEVAYSLWISNLKQLRREISLLTLFSNHQIMILIILLKKSTAQNQVKCHFLEKIFLSTNLIENPEKEFQLTIQCLTNSLRSLRMNGDLSEENISRLYRKYRIDSNENTEICLKKLSQFLHQIFPNERQDFQTIDGNEQYLVRIPSTRNEREIDLDTCCILLNLFPHRFPSSYQILWSSTSTEEDIHLFFARIRIFHSLVFVVMDIDKMHHRLREVLLNEQLSLTISEQIHATVYYFSKELTTTTRNGLRPFTILPAHRDSSHTYRYLVELFQQNQCVKADIQIICGKAGIGKSVIFVIYLGQFINSS